MNWCALMLELLFGQVSVPAWGAECSTRAVLAFVWACECASDAGAVYSDAGAVLAVGSCMWDVNC